MKLNYFLILIIITGCSNISNIEKTDKLKPENKKITNSKIKQESIEIVSPEKLSNLFFENSSNYNPKDIKIKSGAKIIVQQNQNQNIISNINSTDYKVIVDWMVADTRYLKIKNLKTNEEIIIKEGDKNSSIVLVERNLFYYKLKINGQIIEVKR